LLHALNAAAASLQRSAHSEAAVLRAFREQIAGLGLRGTISLLDEEGEHLLVRAVAYPGPSLASLEDLTGLKAEGFEFPLAAVDTYRQVIETGKAVFVPDSSAVIGQLLPKVARPFAEHIQAAFGTASGIFAPLMVEGRVRGVLAVADASLTSEDALAIEAFANHISVALENARLFEQVRVGGERLQALSRRLVEVQEAERRHIARELHDQVGEALTALKLVLEMSARLAADAARERLGEAQILVNELMARVRELSLDLRPAMLDDLGLLPALLWHIERYTGQTGVQVVFKHTGMERHLTPALETAAYRTVQEALTNVARHARVSEVTVRLWADQHTLGVQVDDQGIGFDPATALAVSITGGLVGMRERVALLGGQLTVESAPGSGTRLTAEFPLGNPIEKKKGDDHDQHRAGG
jgi:signal transduction histidine kinase